MKTKKVLLIAKIMDLLGLNNLGLLINKVIHGKNHIRVLNYHSTPKNFMIQFEKQLDYFSKKYSSISKEDLKEFLEGKLILSKPGLIITFDDGLESNYIYAKPVLEKYNFQGWFFIPAGLIGKGNCKEIDKTGKESEIYMNLKQVLNLKENHIIGSHTLTHKRLTEDLEVETVEKEICESKMELERLLKQEVDAFCWVGGEKESYSKKASNLIKICGYKYSFLTNHYPVKTGDDSFKIERTNIEANWPLYLVKFYTSVFMDIKYSLKRNQVKQILD